MKKLVLMSAVLGLAMLSASTAFADNPLRRIGGWRSYSDEPMPATAVQSGYRSFAYEPAYGYGPTATYAPGTFRSYQNATNKALGRVN